MACALDNNAQIINIFPETKGEKIDVINFLQKQQPRVEKILKTKLDQLKAIKWYLTLQVHFIKTNSLGQENNAYPYFRNKCITSLHKSEIRKQVRKAYAHILQKFAEWIRDGSGWTLEDIIQLDINIGKYRAFKGSTYFELPNHLKQKKAIINIKNKDSLCFIWSVLAGIYKENIHPERVSHYVKYLDTLNIKNLDFPLPIQQVKKFERQNTSICVNVYEYSKGNIYPLYISKQNNSVDNKLIDLLYITNKTINHYCLIKNLSRLLREQGKYGNKRYYCRFCLHAFTSQKRLNDHGVLCQKQDAQKVILPTLENRYLQFKNYHKQDKIKFVVYADFESLLIPIQGCQPSNDKSFTQNVHKHMPCAYSYVVVSSIKKYTKPPVTYRGKDAVEHFLYSILKEEDEILDILYKYKPIQMTEQDWKDFINEPTCHICDMNFENDSLRVRDHEHYSGRFRGAAHPNCNIKYRSSKKIPIVIHNLKNYDAHLIMQAIGKIEQKKIKCIPTNMEKYISFSLGKHLIFIDSFQFLSSSLNCLVNNLANEGIDKFDLLTKYISNVDTSLLLRKQVYPYEYMDSWLKFEENKLPSKNSFYSSLSEEHISDDDYNHVIEIWNKCGFKSLGEMCDFYVKTDALLLACVFENFRNLSLQYYKLDPLHYVSLPGLTFDACLRFTKVKLELLTDIDQYLFFENGIRGGISVITERFAQANNPLIKTYDSKKPTSYIVLLDANNLYGYALMQPLPIGEFKWLSKKEIQKLDILSLGNNDVGFVFEVDLEYPQHLHDLHNLYPLAPEKLKVSKNMLSPYLKRLLEKHKIKYTSSVTKLIPNLGNKHKYIVHYRTLQLYIKLGLKVTKIHRVLSFKEKAWVKPYVDFNTEKRRQAKTSFEQDMFKLMLNAFFGKCMENVRKRLKVELVTEKNHLIKRISRPSFESFKIFNKNLVALHHKIVTVKLDKPIFIGFCILDISKIVPYKFHYGFILEIFGEDAILLFGDTDSFCYLIFTKCVYRKFKKYEHLFDTSNYPKNHFLYSIKNKKVVGLFKDEMGGKPIFQFVGLRPKMYSILSENINKKTAKGVTKATIKKHLKHAEYLQALFKEKRFSHRMKSIRSKEHNIYTCQMNKTSICPLDDKRYLLKGGIKSLAYNHYRINQFKHE